MKRKKTNAVILLCAFVMMLAAMCVSASENITEAAEEDSGSSILVACFSRAGENWQVGVVEKGNTAIMAEMLAEKLGADLFMIETVEEYPESYDEMLEVATSQREGDERPELKAMPENLEDYDTIFLGYPIWWGGLPMPIYTFLESSDFSGKTIYPFNTHGGSGVAGTDKEIADIVSEANVMDGFALLGETAQNDQEQTGELIDEYLAGIGY